MKHIFFPLFLFTLLLALATPQVARADGIIIPEPPLCPMPICIDPPCPPSPPCPPTPLAQLVIRYHHVEVDIEDQIAITKVDQVFYNPNDWAIEGTYLFPIPPDATLTSFKLWIDGKAVEGEILDAEEARKKYEEIVTALRDPALLEYVDRSAVQARIFPVPPRGERRIALEYAQVLSLEGNLMQYLYPLSTEKFSIQPLESVVINVKLRSTTPLRAIHSPSHPISLQQTSPYEAQVSYEANQIRPDQDFSLLISVGESQAIHVLSYQDANDPSDPHGTFMLLLTPSPQMPTERIAKDVLLVLDRSGSMDGEKFTQALQALEYILDHLNPEDRFNILAFSTDILQYRPTLRSAAEAAEAKRWLKDLIPEGSTDIYSALLQAIQMIDSDRPTYLIFLTDGLPTIGIQDSAAILDSVRQKAPPNLRLFPFGVGYDVDTFLLDSLAQENHGQSTYVRAGENLNRVVAGFYERIETPVLTNIAFDFGEINVYDLYPSPLPDLFAGSQILLVGRYKEGGRTDIRLTGEINGQPQIFLFRDQVFERPQSTPPSVTQAALPRLWATRKIGHLLTQIRLKGADPETIQQIVRLSIRYGIVTPYTSYLVTEESPLSSAEQMRISGEAWQDSLSTPSMEISGIGAVQKAAEQGAMSVAEAPLQIEGDLGQKVKVIAGRTFVYSDGKWVDTAFDPDKMKTHPVAFLSEDYFRLLRAYPSLGAAFSLGERVIALANGTAYEIVPANTNVPPLPIEELKHSDKPNQQETLTDPTAEPESLKLFPCLSSILLMVTLFFIKLRF